MATPLEPVSFRPAEQNPIGDKTGSPPRTAGSDVRSPGRRGPRRDKPLNANHAKLLGSLVAAAIVSVAVAAAAPILSPLALASILFALLALAMWWTLFRLRSPDTTHSSQVRELAHELLASRRLYERLFTAACRYNLITLAL